MKTRQEIFEIGARHLLNQGERSERLGKTGDMFCSYRGDEGRKCVIGALIPDDKYDPNMEERGVYSLLIDFPECLDVVDDEFFLTSLQQIHDRNLPISWKEKLYNLGKEWNLDTSFLDSLELSS